MNTVVIRLKLGGKAVETLMRPTWAKYGLAHLGFPMRSPRGAHMGKPTYDKVLTNGIEIHIYLRK